MTRPSRIMAAVLLAVGLASGTAGAQQRLVVVGVVQWTSTSRVQMMTDAGVSVSIDVSGLDQSVYTALRAGDRLRVVGVVAPDRTRLIAETIEPTGPGGGFWGLFPQAP
jgi:hypothetical protein